MGEIDEESLYEITDITDSPKVDFTISPDSPGGDRVKEVTARKMTPDGKSDPDGFIKKFDVGSETYYSVEIVK